MTRLDELTAALADDELDAPGETELRALLDDPEARERHLALLAVEAGLRGGRAVDLRAPVLERLQRDIGTRVVANVMREVRKGASVMPRHRIRAAWPIAVAACLGLTIWTATRARRAARDPAGPATPATLASVDSVQGGAVLVRAGVRSALGAPRNLGAGDRLEVDPSGAVHLSFPEGIALVLEAGTVI